MRKNSHLPFLIFLNLIIIPAHAETSEELFKKVFGQDKSIQEASVGVVFEERILGDIKAKIQGEKLISVNRDQLIQVLQPLLKQEFLLKLHQKKLDLKLEDLEMEGKFSFQDLQITLNPVDDVILPIEKSFLDDYIPYYASKAIRPAPFSFQLNYKVEYVEQERKLGKDYADGIFDQAVSLKDVVIDNNINYKGDRENKWYRQTTILTYDFENKLTRFQAGDIANNIIGYGQSKSIGGVSLFKDFSLNPYRVNYPTSRFDFTLDRRSLVRTYVNNLLIKSEYLNSGKHTLKDIPLNNGVNKIFVEIEDEFGQKRFLNFNEASSQDLLSRGQNRFDLTVGNISEDQEKQKKYLNEKGTFYSAYYQYGMRKNLTFGGYTQGIKKFNLLGEQTILASKRGNLIFDVGHSDNGDYGGWAQKLTYQLNLFGPYWYDSHTLTMRVENRDPRFNETEVKSTNFHNILSSLTYSVPVLDTINLSFGANHGRARVKNASDKWGGEASLGARVTKDSTLTFSYSRQRDQERKWQTQAYVFYNISFAEQSTYASAFYDRESDLRRLSVIRDSGKRFDDIKLIANIDDSKDITNANFDATYNSQLVDLGVRVDRIDRKDSAALHRISPRVLGGIAVAYNEGEWGGTITRPINGSFAIFKPSKNFRNQEFGIRSFGNEKESKNGLFKEASIAGLIPYQYRQVQLDPTFLEPGYSLGQESFVLYPKYKSGHLFVVGESGQIAYRGKIMAKNKKPVALQVGFLVDAEKDGKGEETKVIPFFTNKGGVFLIEGLAPKKYNVKIESFNDLEIDLVGKQGYVDAGELTILGPKDTL